MVKRQYKIAYIKGELPKSPNELLKLKTISGKLFLNKNDVRIKGDKENFDFKNNECVLCEYKKRQLFGFIILKSKKHTINLLIPRINIFNWFITTNFFATISLYNYLKKKICPVLIFLYL